MRYTKPIIERRRVRPTRQGLSVVLVLGLLSLTLALAYAMLRSQVMSVQVQSNLNRQTEARQAAMSGMMIALRKMHQSDWAGVDTTLGGTLQSGTTYLVTYTTGDPNLSPGDDDYSKYPYRVTLTSIGSVANYENPAAPATAELQMVVELVPRALSSEPDRWVDAQDYAVIAWDDSTAIWQTPARIEGRVRLSGELELCEEYPPVSRPWHGTIDEVAIFASALSEGSLQAMYNAGLAGDSTLPGVYTSFSPQHYWRLNESSGATQAADSMGSANGSYEAGTVAGASGGPFGGSNGAAHFDGRNDHIHVGNLDVAGSAFTMCAWFKADSFDNTDARILSKAVGTATDEHHWMLSTTQSGGSMRLRMRVRTGGSTSTLIASSGNLSTGTWYFAAAVYDGSQMRLYLNGVQVGSQTKIGTLDTDSTVPVYIGDNPPGSPRARYLRDLEAMRAAGEQDWRPFDGPVELPYSESSAATLALLQDDLNVTTIDTSAGSFSGFSHPGNVSTYQLYPGGKTYHTTTLSNYVQRSDLAPDVETNPLGIVTRNSMYWIDDNVEIEGTIITHGSSHADIYFSGDNVQLKPVSLPPLYGTTDPVQLPAAIVYDDIYVREPVSNSIEGVIAVGDDFSVSQGDQSTEWNLQGLLITKDLRLGGRDQWDGIGSTTWESWLTQFVNQLNDGTPINYFPQWLASQQSLNSEPKLQISGPASAVRYHWHDFSQPVFVAHPDDNGLRWDIVRWNLP